MKKSKKIRVILTAAAALITGAVLFVKRKAIKRHFGIYSVVAAVIIGGVMMCGMTAYAAELDTEPGAVITDSEPETDSDTDAEPDGDVIIEVITGDEIEIDIGDFLDPEREPNQITPPGNLTLVDDFDGAQANDKQFITVTTKNGNYFYIIIDRAGNRENVYFLNLVDEYDLLQILQGEDAEAPALPPGAATTTPEEPTGQDDPPGETPQQPRNTNTTRLLIGVLVIAAVGGGAFYYFKVMKPKQGAGKKSAVKSELDEFDFEPDDDDLFSDSADEPDGAEYDEYGDTDNDNGDGEIPDFTAKDEPAAEPEQDSDGFSFETADYDAETPESEGE